METVTTPVPPAAAPTLGHSRRWLAFSVLGLGTLMNVLDTTIANIALKPIGTGLHFTDAGLAWVINAYLLTFGGFLLLAGRMGDLYGPRRMFLIGLTVFTLASLACGLAPDQATLVTARAVQGLGAAGVAAVSLGIIMNLFPEGPDRAKAMGVFAFIASGGGALGAVVGGYVTQHFDWHWNFLINVPIGIAVFIGTLATVPKLPATGTGRLDVGGAVTVTGALLAAVYAVLEAKTKGWTSAVTLSSLTAAAGLLATFVWNERNVASPLVPLGIFRRRTLVVSNVVGVLWAAAMFGWFFFASLYAQNVLQLDAQTTGFAFVPADAIMALFSLWLSARIVARFGIRKPMVVGLLVASAGLFLFARAPLDGTVGRDILPSMLIVGVGAGMAFNPVFLAATSDVKPEEAGLASGLLNTAFMMGGALGLAGIATAAASRTQQLAHEGEIPSLAAGFRLAFAIAACAALAAALLGLLVRDPPPGTPAAPGAALT